MQLLYRPKSKKKHFCYLLFLRYWGNVLFMQHLSSWKTSKHFIALPFSLITFASKGWKLLLKRCFPTVVQLIRLQIRELFMLISRKRYWFLMTAAARWTMLFPSKQKILFPITFMPHRSNFWRPFIHYRLQLCFLSSVSSGTTHYANVFCVSLLDSPSPLFVSISVLPSSFSLLGLAKPGTGTPLQVLQVYFFTEFCQYVKFLSL